MEKKSPYQIERLETQAQLDMLEAEWKDLIADIPDAPVFLTWEWIRTWWLYFGESRQLWLLTARDAQGRLVGIAPLMREQYRINLIKLRILKFIGTGQELEVHNNFLIRTLDQGGVTQAFLAYLISQSKDWDVISLASLVPESSLINVFAAAGGRVRTGIKKHSVYVPLPGDWETYQKSLTKKLRRNLKYFRSKLEGDYPGNVGFVCVNDPLELPEVMKRLDELSKKRWHAKERTSNFDYPNFSAFHQTVACLALDRGWLRFYQLTVSGRPIASCYNFHFHNRVYAYAIGFDLDWSAYSPGRLAIANCIQASIQEGAIEYDWGAGEEVYKLAWTDQVRVEPELLFSRNLIGGLWIEWRSSREALKETLTLKARQWLPQSTRDRVNQFLSPHYKKSDAQGD